LVELISSWRSLVSVAARYVTHDGPEEMLTYYKTSTLFQLYAILFINLCLVQFRQMAPESWKQFNM